MTGGRLASPTDKRHEAAILARIGRTVGTSSARHPYDFIPHEPHPRQREFLGLDSFEALYGGAAGGGKSDALLMAAAQYVHFRGYAALLLRRTFPDLALPGAIMDRAKSWWDSGIVDKARDGWKKPDGIHWSAQDKRFTFPSGATITFGYLDSEDDWTRYKSAEFQFIGFDELTEFPELWYTRLLSRIRRGAGVQVPLRARGGTNPGGIGHDWVYGRFVKGGIGRKDRAFVPARIEDNEHLDQAAYRVSLAALDSTTRKQLEEGVWIRSGKGLVYHTYTDANLIDCLPESKAWRRLLAQDYGHTDALSWVIWAWRDHDSTAYMERAWKITGVIPSRNAAIVRELDAVYHFDRIVGDIGGLGKGYVEEARSRFYLPIEAAEKQNKLGYIKLFNGDMERLQIRIVRDACQDWVDEAVALPWDKTQTKEDPGFPNHCTDGGLYGWRAVKAWTAEPEEDLPPAVVRHREEWDVQTMFADYKLSGKLPPGIDAIELETLAALDAEERGDT